MRFFTLLLSILLLLTGCGAQIVPQPESGSGVSRDDSSLITPSKASTGAIPVEQFTSSAAETVAKITPNLDGCTYIQNYYICSVIDETLSGILKEEMTDYEKLLAVYRYLITQVAFFDEPVGTDIWRYRGDPENTPSIYEVRSLSPLLFGIGSCEDYASAFVTLCDRMGFSAKYVPGLTYSVEGKLVPHAWAMVKLDGTWYHADPQLEDNIIKPDLKLRYRYFLKDDRLMAGDHRWGSLLDAPNEYALSLPKCPTAYSDTQPEIIEQAKRPDRVRILKQLAAEKGIYEKSHPPMGEYTLESLPE